MGTFINWSLPLSFVLKILLEDGALIHGSKHALDPEDKEAEEGDQVVTIDCMPGY